MNSLLNKTISPVTYAGIRVADYAGYLNPEMAKHCVVRTMSDSVEGVVLTLVLDPNVAIKEFNPDFSMKTKDQTESTDRAKSAKKKTRREQTPVKRVLCNPPATIIFWKDGSKTVAVQRDGDVIWDDEKGFTFAYIKHGGFNYKQFCWDLKHFMPKKSFDAIATPASEGDSIAESESGEPNPIIDEKDGADPVTIESAIKEAVHSIDVPDAYLVVDTSKMSQDEVERLGDAFASLHGGNLPVADNE